MPRLLGESRRRRSPRVAQRSSCTAHAPPSLIYVREGPVMASEASRNQAAASVLVSQ